MLRLLKFLIILLTTPDCVFAQQSLFNVPSVEITEENKVFFQEQINFLTNGVANTTLDYGLGNGWDMGISFFNFNFYSTENSWQNPMLLLNIEKGINLTTHWKIGLGSQSGFTLPLHENTSQFASFNYLNNALDLDDWGKYYLGAYYANNGYAGQGNSVNLMAGLELKLTQTIHLMANYINGNNEISTAVVGLVWYATPNWQFSLGAQLPVPETLNHVDGIVLELTRL